MIPKKMGHKKYCDGLIADTCIDNCDTCRYWKCLEGCPQCLNEKWQAEYNLLRHAITDLLCLIIIPPHTQECYGDAGVDPKCKACQTIYALRRVEKYLPDYWDKH